MEMEECSWEGVNKWKVEKPELLDSILFVVAETNYSKTAFISYSERVPKASPISQLGSQLGLLHHP